MQIIKNYTGNPLLNNSIQTIESLAELDHVSEITTDILLKLYQKHKLWELFKRMKSYNMLFSRNGPLLNDKDFGERIFKGIIEFTLKNFENKGKHQCEISGLESVEGKKNLMRFKISLSPTSEPSVIPINYQYPLSAAIYKVLHKADADYAAFLHQKGYQAADSLKNFKLFTFSDLSVHFKLKGDRMHLHSAPELVVSFHLPTAAETFVKGLFLSEQLDIADRKSKASFKIDLVNALPDPFNGLDADEVILIRVTAASACVAGRKDSKGNYDFISPEDARFSWVVQHNWEEKLKSVGIYEAGDVLGVRVLPFQTAPKSRLITIKAFTQSQTRIKGFTRFGMELTAKRKYLELIYNSGAGVYNALGMGCLEGV